MRTALDPREYHKVIDPSVLDIYAECANISDAISTNYENGVFYAEFESESDLMDFSYALHDRNQKF